MHVCFNGFHKLDIFLAGIGIIKAQITEPVELSGETEIETDGFRMTDMQIAVRLRRKPRVNPAAVLVLPNVLDNYISNKMRRRSLCGCR